MAAACADFNVKTVLILEHEAGSITDEELFLLLEEDKKRNTKFPCWNYEKFEMSSWNEDECWTDFRFNHQDLYRSKTALDLPDRMVAYNRQTFKGMEGLCLMLRRLAFPCRFSDLITGYGRHVAQLWIIYNHMIDHIYDTFWHLLKSFDQNWLLRPYLQSFADAIHRAGAPLDNCWGFIDGTLRAIARPEENQRVMYSGHKKAWF